MRPVSSLDPTARLLCLALLSSAALFASIWTALGLALGLVLLLSLEGHSPLKVLRESAFLAIFIVFAGVLECVDIGPGFAISLAAPVETPILGARLLAGYLGGRLYYATTSVSQTRDAATRISRKLPGLSRFDIGFVFSLILGFIPLIIEEWTLSVHAAKARAYGARSRLRGSELLISAYLRRLMLRAVAAPESLAVRGWNGNRLIESLPWRRAEFIVCAACLCLATLAALHVV